MLSSRLQNKKNRTLSPIAAPSGYVLVPLTLQNKKLLSLLEPNDRPDFGQKKGSNQQALWGQHPYYDSYNNHSDSNNDDDNYDHKAEWKKRQNDKLKPPSRPSRFRSGAPEMVFGGKNDKMTS